uniref:Transposase n=1 Tax=Loa loa TaxID=7209 RepID=A0A1I7VU77_LOALO
MRSSFIVVNGTCYIAALSIQRLGLEKDIRQIIIRLTIKGQDREEGYRTQQPKGEKSHRIRIHQKITQGCE